MVEMNLKCSLGCCKLMFSLVAIKKRLTHIRPVILLERPRPYTPRVSICFIPLCFASDLVILAFSLISIISSIIKKKPYAFPIVRPE